MPPAIFMVSLSGIIVIMARGIMRLRRAGFSESIKAAQSGTTAFEVAEVLRPTQKSVQAIRSRGALMKRWVGQARGGMSGLYQRSRGGMDKVGSLAARSAESTRTAGQGLWSKLRRRQEESFEPIQEPNLDVLFAPTPPAIKTKVVEQPSEPKATPTLSLQTVRRATTAKSVKKLSPLQRAQVALQEKNYQHAEDILVDYILHHTKDTKAYMLLGRVATARADWSEAMEIYEQVVSWQPNEPGAQAGLGIAAYNCGRYSRALQALQRANEEDPTNLVVLKDLLEIARKMDNPALQRSIQTKLRDLAAREETNPVGLRS